MPVSSYPISAILNDVDGSTAVEGATLTLINGTKQERQEYTTASDGSVTGNLQDFNTDYENGDIIYGCLHINGKSTWFKHTVDTGVGSHDAGTLNLHWGSALLHDTKIFAGVASSTNADDYVEFWSVHDERIKLSRINFVENATHPFNLGYIGTERFVGGVAVIRSSDAANRIDVSLIGR